MAGTLDGEDTFGAGSDVQPRQTLVHVQPQAGQPQRRAIVEQVLGGAAADLADRLGQFDVCAPAVRQPAAAELEQFVVAFAELAPAAVACLAPDRRIVAFQGDFALGNEEASAVARLQPAAGDQAVVGLDHAGGADRLVTGQCADRRQTSTGAQALLFDPGLEFSGELLHQRDRALAVEGEVHRGGCLLILSEQLSTNGAWVCLVRCLL